MKETKSVSVRLDYNTFSQLKYLCDANNTDNTKMIKSLINDKYNAENTPAKMNQREKRKCMVSLCKIVNDVATIEDERVKKNVFEEVDKICQILK